MKLTLSLIACIIIISISSCYYDKEELLYGVNNQTCTDTVGTISYAQKVVPVLRQNCYSCHTGASPSGNILMGTYAADKSIAQNGKLYGSISYSAGYSPMPQGAAKLSTCNIAVIKKWVDAGMLNN